MSNHNRVELTRLSSFRATRPNQWMRRSAIFVCSIFLMLALILSITPWMQTSVGTGIITALDPNDRIQMINSPITGRIERWYINDGAYIKEGDPIVDLIDIDPLYMQRLTTERDAVFKKYQAAKLSAETAAINLKRQQDLFTRGLAAQKDYEYAKINYQKLLSEEASAAASLAKMEVRLSRQQTQKIAAPKDGSILRVFHGAGSTIVKEGEALASFVPKVDKHAVELFIDGNDLPLIMPGKKVRLQFEGWPAVQFSGWPNVAIGTFGGQIQSVDHSVMPNGKFRILVIEDNTQDGNRWPDPRFLRQGGRVHGWILLSKVRLGFEWWRKLNGFPPAIFDDVYKREAFFQLKKNDNAASSTDKKNDPEKEGDTYNE